MGFTDTRNAGKSAAKGRAKGAEVKKQKLLPSETFDWDKAIRNFKKLLKEVYADDK